MTLLILAFLVLPLGGTPSAPPPPVCKAADATSAHLIQYLTGIATGTDVPYTTMRDSLHVPAVAANQISLITQENTCKKAAATYDARIVSWGGTAKTRQIYVVRVGSTYAAFDPTESTIGSEWRPLILMTNQYVFISSWGK